MLYTYLFWGTSNAALGGSANVNQNASSNCVNFTNDDCVAKFGEGAFCQNETCFCDRQSSFTTATGQCGMFWKWKHIVLPSLILIFLKPDFHKCLIPFINHNNYSSIISKT